MMFGGPCSTFTTLPTRRMNSGSLSSFEASMARLKELRLPPPTQHRRRRMSVSSSQAALAGSGHDYLSERGCYSSLGLGTDLWRDSVAHSELLNQVSIPQSTRSRMWSGRSDGATLQASLKNLKSGSDYTFLGSRGITSDEQSMLGGEDFMHFGDSLLQHECAEANYERGRRR